MSLWECLYRLGGMWYSLVLLFLLQLVNDWLSQLINLVLQLHEFAHRVVMRLRWNFRVFLFLKRCRTRMWLLRLVFFNRLHMLRCFDMFSVCIYCRFGRRSNLLVKLSPLGSIYLRLDYLYFFQSWWKLQSIVTLLILEGLNGVLQCVSTQLWGLLNLLLDIHFRIDSLMLNWILWWSHLCLGFIVLGWCWSRLRCWFWMLSILGLMFGLLRLLNFLWSILRLWNRWHSLLGLGSLHFCESSLDCLLLRIISLSLFLWRIQSVHQLSAILLWLLHDQRVCWIRHRLTTISEVHIHKALRWLCRDVVLWLLILHDCRWLTFFVRLYHILFNRTLSLLLQRWQVWALALLHWRFHLRFWWCLTQWFRLYVRGWMRVRRQRSNLLRQWAGSHSCVLMATLIWQLR